MPQRILLFLTDLEIGGTPTVVRELAIRLRDAKTEIEVACLSSRGPVADQLRDAGVQVTAFDATSQSQVIRATQKLITLIRSRKFDTVVSFLIHANVVASLASRFCSGVRLIQSIQTTQEKPRWHWMMQSIAQRSAEIVIVPSASAARVAVDRAHIPAEKIVVIPNAVDPDEFTRSRIPLDAAEKFPIGFIGRLDPVKRLDDLIDAIAMIKDRVHLHVFGEGPERAHLESKIRALDLSRTITLHGAIARPQEALKQIGLLVLPSSAEGFGLVLIEAMAAGVPIVATNVPGIRDVVRDRSTALLVDAFAPSQLANAIRQLMEDEKLRTRLIEGGLHEVRERFSWDVALPMYRRILQHQ